MFLLYHPSPSPEKKDRMNIWYPHHNWLCLPPPRRRFSGFEDSVEIITILTVVVTIITIVVSIAAVVNI